MTVGLYVPWGRCKDALLNKIKKHLCNISDKTENSTATTAYTDTPTAAECQYKVSDDGSEESTDEKKKLTVKELFKLVFLMLFCNPLMSKNHEKPQRRHVFVKFSALHCIGCDRLWAGLITTLCDDIEDEFGRIPISIYRALYKKKEITDKPSKKWVPKKILHIPIWFVTLFVFLFLACALLLKYLLFDKLGEPEQYEIITEYTLYTALSIFGTYSLLLSGTTFKLISNYTVTQKAKLMHKLKRTDMSSQLGFMNDVKKEIEIITSYLQMMEMYLKQNIRVIIEITKLDKCLPDRVVEILHAINILLSNPDAPFISILAVDPGIIVECVEKSDLLKGMANNGYLFLNRIVTLPFSIPKMNDNTKTKHLENIIKDTNINKYRNLPSKKINGDKSNSSETDPLKQVQETDFIKKALHHLKSKECRTYITDNVINMRRIVNTIIITVRLMINDKKYDHKQCPVSKVSEWVIMAAQWPCSLSWILQSIEDEQQSGMTKGSEYNGRKLLDIYEMSLDALYANKESLKQLLELDGDPDIFCEFLKETKLTVEDANILRANTINLDHTIKRKIELLQSSLNFGRMKKDKALTSMALLDMNTDDVCKKMEDENLSEYKHKIKEHNLDGKALLYANNEELRNILEMNLGDWVKFRATFLSLPTPNHFF